MRRHTVSAVGITASTGTVHYDEKFFRRIDLSRGVLCFHNMNMEIKDLRLFAFMDALVIIENESRRRPTIRALADRLGCPSSLALIHSLLELAERMGLVQCEYTHLGRRVWFGSVDDWTAKLYEALLEMESPVRRRMPEA